MSNRIKMPYENVIDKAKQTDDYNKKKYPLILGHVYTEDITNNQLDIIDLDHTRVITVLGASGSGKTWAVEQYVLGLKKLDIDLTIFDVMGTIFYQELHSECVMDKDTILVELKKLQLRKVTDKKKVIILEEFTFLNQYYKEQGLLGEFINILTYLLKHADLLNLTFIITTQRLIFTKYLKHDQKKGSGVLIKYSDILIMKKLNTELDNRFFTLKELKPYLLMNNFIELLKKPNRRYYSLNGIEIANFYSFSVIKHVKTNTVTGLFTPVPLTEGISSLKDIRKSVKQMTEIEKTQ